MFLTVQITHLDVDDTPTCSPPGSPFRKRFAAAGAGTRASGAASRREHGPGVGCRFVRRHSPAVCRNDPIRLPAVTTAFAGRL
ncbi:uncharacterized protein Nmlp_3121 [Natronomonas moolapensis 8.8.11]|uniref:Uncharacterized protein n=1 Tax=Natronomonas moolapensis (strain DSM 18674 / CECT 7526 / JCM 14361 / 8.8.11) TaxID=268739 RepID=M1XSC4_NATM8|nr:uncharacterized protein Nmlp_3121 [Natronomonas moolapensis 8.8.11]